MVACDAGAPVSAAAAAACAACGGAAAGLVPLPDFARLGRVTSDVKPWPAGGGLAVCGACGAVQKPPDAAWLAEIAAIYRAYDIYHQAGGVEQAVFDPAVGAPRRRSAQLVDRLARAADLPAAGRVLDIGCGNGAFLAAFGERFPGWRLHGQELDRRHADRLAALPGFAGLHVGDPAGIAGRFALVSLIHSLEHFPEPLAALRTAAGLVAPGGLLFVQVPDLAANPFDLLVADHRSHFDAARLRLLAAWAGLDPVVLAGDWTGKELSLLARPGAVAPPAAHPVPLPPDAEAAAARTQAQLAWLHRVAADASAAAGGGGRFGLFGTGIAAVWLFGALAGAVAFFVDEDPGRIGRTCLGRPILAPDAVPAGARVAVPLAPAAAAAVVRRFAGAPWTPLPLPADGSAPGGPAAAAPVPPCHKADR